MKQRPFCDRRPSMKSNYLLQKPKMGKTAAVTQDLPPEDFRYGKVFHQQDGVKELMQAWGESRQKSTRRGATPVAKRMVNPRQNFVATNRAAVRAGCVSSRDFRDFKKKNEILVKPEANYSAEEAEYNKVLHRTMTHGKPTPVNSEMKDCLTYKFSRDNVERARQMQTIRHTPKADVVKKRSNHGIKPTRASRGHTVKPTEGPTHAETFKMKRFLAIDHCAIEAHW